VSEETISGSVEALIDNTPLVRPGKLAWELFAE